MRTFRQKRPAPLAGRWVGVIHGARGDAPVTLILHPRTDGDVFRKIDGAWLFAERRLYVDWLEERALS